jgi:hypothetical protein
MVDECIRQPGSLVGYLTKTRDWAEELVWDPLRAICQEHGHDVEFNNAKLRAVFPNGSKIRLAGAKDKAQTEVLRGFGYRLLVIDEAGSIDPIVMRYVTREILPAALGETKGTLLVVGTPNESCAGYFHDISTKPNTPFSVHHWTQRENICFPRWTGCKGSERDRMVDEYLKEERSLHGYSETDPEYQREYMGLWAKDEQLFIYRITADNLRHAPGQDKDKPDHIEYRYVLAIDLGWHDMTAFELVGYDQDSQKMYEIDSTQEQHMTLDKIAEVVNAYAEDYELDKIILDTAGAGKMVQETMARDLANRFGVPCAAAQKNRKATNMKLLNSDFRTHRAYLLPDGVCKDQMQSLQWDGNRLREKEPQPGQFIDNADAYLYAYRECYHWLHEEREIIPEANTPERANWEAEQMLERELEEFEQQKEKDWWEHYA